MTQRLNAIATDLARAADRGTPGALIEVALPHKSLRLAATALQSAVWHPMDKLETALTLWPAKCHLLFGYWDPATGQIVPLKLERIGRKPLSINIQAPFTHFRRIDCGEEFVALEPADAT